jgi:hypothetical protein
MVLHPAGRKNSHESLPSAGATAPAHPSKKPPFDAPQPNVSSHLTFKFNDSKSMISMLNDVCLGFSSI